MATIYTFGDSFSEDFEIFSKERFKKTWRYDYIHNFLNGNSPETFSKIIADKLNYNHECKAGIHGAPNEGNCNQSMFNNFFLTSPKISENDIVFFGYTSPIRFKWYNPKSQILNSVLPNNLIENVSDEEVNAMEQYMLTRDQKAWSDEYVKLEVFIKEFAKCKNFKVFFWSHEDLIYKNLKNHIVNNTNWLLGKDIIDNNYSLNILLQNNGGYSICEETKNQNKDSHYGKTAHKVLADLFLKEILKNFDL